MNCQKCRILIEKHLEGLLDDSELSVLKRHLEECSVCRERFEACTKVENAVKEAFSSRTSPAEARASILAKIPRVPALEPGGSVSLAGYRGVLISLIAGALLLVGILIGIALTRIIPVGQESTRPQAHVPVKVTGFEGRVLVKHSESDTWEELAPSSNVYLGDLFQSTGKSSVTLRLADGATVTVNANTALSLDTCDGGIELTLNYGTAKAVVTGTDKPFVITTPQGRIEALGTEFTVSVE